MSTRLALMEEAKGRQVKPELQPDRRPDRSTINDEAQLKKPAE
jgi:hypothetical protein